MTSELPFRAYTGTESYIFVSYAHVDKDIVYPEMLWIHDKGFRVWYDEGIPLTSEWDAEIEEALIKCKLFLVFITPNAIERPMVRNEIKFALDNDKLFLAIFLKPTELKYGLKLRINSLQYVKKYELKEDYYAQKVLEALKKVESIITISEEVKEKERLDAKVSAVKKDEEKLRKEAVANLKNVISFIDAEIPQFEAEVLQEIEMLTKKKFTKVYTIEYNTQMGFTTENNHITGIGIYDCGLTTLPESLGKLSSLQILKLDDNEFKNLPESIGNLTSLLELWLRNNQLKTLPESLEQLSSLRSLFLDNNQLSTLPETIIKQKSLLILYLDNNQLITIPESFGKLRSLQSLSLSDNQLTTLPEAIGNLKSLQILYLDNNQLSTLPESIGNLESIYILNLNNNQLKTLPESLGQLSSLHYLFLEHNKFSTLPESMGQLSSLQNLYLDNNQLITIPESIGQISSLNELHLEYNQLTTLPELVKKLQQKGITLYK